MDVFAKVIAGAWAALQPGDDVDAFLGAIARAAAADPPSLPACALHVVHTRLCLDS